jgi:hypothetical protein
MTDGRKNDESTAVLRHTSTLPFDPADLMDLRVKPAQFARMVGVSKQAVSKAIQTGKLMLGPDGKINPKKGLREYLENSDPTRVRVRTFKQAMTETEDLRARVRVLEVTVARLRDDVAAARADGDARVRAAQFAASDTTAIHLARLINTLAERLEEASAAHRAGDWKRWSDEFLAVEFYGFDLAEYRQLVADDAHPVSRSAP